MGVTYVPTTAEIVQLDGKFYPAIVHGETVLVLEPEFGNQLGMKLTLTSLEAKERNKP